MLQGLLIFAGTGLVLFGIIALIEYFSWLSVGQKTVLFWSIAAVETSLFGYYLLWPLYQISTNGKALTDRKAAHVIGTNLSGVSDRLTNYLELKELAKSNELIDAGINQKQVALNRFSFKDAIHFSALRPFLLFLLPLALLLMFIWSGNRWFMLAEGAGRLMNFSTEYQRQLPFKIVINQKLAVDEGEDFTLNFTVKGKLIPEQLVLKSASGQSVVARKNRNEYSITFLNCVRDVPFSFGYDDVFSQEYVLKVSKKVVVGRVTFSVSPPPYTKIAPYKIENSALVEVPQFSSVEVVYAFKNTPSLYIQLTSASKIDTFLIREKSTLKVKANQNVQLLAYHANQELYKSNIKVVPDNRPDLDVLTDSSAAGIKIYINANDDYGIVKSNAVFFVNDVADETVSIPVHGTLLKSELFFSNEDLKFLDKVRIDVYDQHGVTTRTIDIKKYREKEKTESDLLNSAGEQLDEIAKPEKKTKNSPQQKSEKTSKKAEQIKADAEELVKRDSVLYQRFEELSEEILKISKELEKNIPEDRRKITEKKLEEKIAELEKEWMILKTIEQLKQVEDSLAKTEKPISEKQMNNLQKSADDLEKKMSEDKKAENVEWEKFDELEKKNDEFEKESEQGDSKENSTKQKEEDIKKEMKEDSESLREQLSKMSDIMMMETTQKNVDMIRRLEMRALKNSKNQEEVYTASVGANQIEKGVQVAQKEVNQSAKSILDSLSSLTISDAMLAEILMEHQLKLDENLKEMEKMNVEDTRGYVSNQRYLQFGLNELAAILYDILKAESESLKNMKEGNKECKNPKPGKGKKPSLSQQQKELGEKMGKSSKPKQGGKNKQTMTQSDLLELIKGQEQILEQYEQKGGNKSGDAKLAEEMNKQLDDLINGNIDKALERNKSIEDKLIALEQSENQKKEQKEERQSKENHLNYDAIKSAVVEDYLKRNQKASGIVNLPALKNYFSTKWVGVNRE